MRYQIYDPRTAQLVDGGACGATALANHLSVRDPFPNNQVPILNPMYKFYEALYPHANNVPGVVAADGRIITWLRQTPFNWDYKALHQPR